MSILIGFICLLLAGFLLFLPSVRKLPNRFLAVFLILTAIELSAWIWVNSSNASSAANGFRMALGALQMPAFLGVFVSSCYSDFKLKFRDFLHLLPFAAALILTLPGNQIPFITAVGGEHAITEQERNLRWLVSHAQYYIYMIFVGVVLLRFRKLFKEHYSGAKSETLTWLSQLAAASLFAHTLILARDGLGLYTNEFSLVSWLQILGALIALAITTWIALKSLFQPHLFRDVDRNLMDIGGQPSGEMQHDDERVGNLNRLLKYMDDKEPYLDPDISLAELSRQVAMTPREVSETINQSIGAHFFDFINGYRVKKAQQLLKAVPRQTVSQILYAVGFNSKSSFNTAFKKHAGVTPTEYRK